MPGALPRFGAGRALFFGAVAELAVVCGAAALGAGGSADSGGLGVGAADAAVGVDVCALSTLSARGGAGAMTALVGDGVTRGRRSFATPIPAAATPSVIA